MESAGEILRQLAQGAGTIPKRKSARKADGDQQILIETNAIFSQKRVSRSKPETAILTRHQTQLIEAASQIMESWPGREELGYFCPTPRKGLIGGKVSGELVPLLREIGEEDASSNSDSLADFVCRLAGVFIQDFGVLESGNIGSWATTGLSPRPR